MSDRSVLCLPSACIVTTLALLAITHAALASSWPSSPGLAASAQSAPAGNAFAASALPLAARFEVRGVIAEAIDAGPYVYLRVRSDEGAESWMVGLSATSATSGRVRALVVGRAEAFESRRLGRVFPTLSFAVIRAAEEI